MAEIHKTVTIDVPVEKVFDIVDDPENYPKYVPNVSQVVDVRRTDSRIGDSFRVIYKVLGTTFDEKFTTTDYQRPTRINSAFNGGITATFRSPFQPVCAHTHAPSHVHYPRP